MVLSHDLDPLGLRFSQARSRAALFMRLGLRHSLLCGVVLSGPAPSVRGRRALEQQLFLGGVGAGVAAGAAAPGGPAPGPAAGAAARAGEAAPAVGANSTVQPGAQSAKKNQQQLHEHS